MDSDEPEADHQAGPAPDPEVGDTEPTGSADSGDPSGSPTTGPDDPEPHTALPAKVEAWRKRSAAGAILTGFALGLQEALEVHRDEPSIVVQTSGDPPDDLPVEADFEYGRPRQSVVSIRPWLLGSQASQPADPSTDASGGESAGRS